MNLSSGMVMILGIVLGSVVGIVVGFWLHQLGADLLWAATLGAIWGAAVYLLLSFKTLR